MPPRLTRRRAELVLSRIDAILALRCGMRTSALPDSSSWESASARCKRAVERELTGKDSEPSELISRSYESDSGD
jgi:hypothetical protein